MNELEALRAWCRVERARAWALRRAEDDEDTTAFCDGRVDAFEDLESAIDALAQPLGGTLQPQVGAAAGAQPSEGEAGVTDEASECWRAALMAGAEVWGAAAALVEAGTPQEGLIFIFRRNEAELREGLEPRNA